MKHSLRQLLFALSLLAPGGAVRAQAPIGPDDGDPDYRRTIEQEYELEAGAEVKIEHSMGPVRVEAWEGDRVRVKALVEVTGRDAEEFGKGVELVISKSRSTWSLRTKYPKRSGSNLSFGVSLDVSMPRNHPLEVRGTFGDVSVRGIEESVRVRSSNGDLDLTAIRGGITSTSSFGDVELTDCNGEARIASSNGAVRVDQHGAGCLRVDSNFGDVRLRTIGENVELDCDNGDVDVRDVKGSVRVVASFGNHSYEDIGGSLDVEGANGAVHALNIGGEARIERSFGEVRLEDAAKSARISCSNGAVRVRRLGGPLDLRGSFGKVDAEETGPVEVSYANGAVHLRDVRGSVRVGNSFGPVSVRGVEGDVFVRAENASVQVRDLRPRWRADDQEARDGGAAPRVECTTSFGSVEVELPLPGSFRLDASTTFGSIRSDFELRDLQRGLSSERCRTTVGAGDMSVSLHSKNGDVRLLKGMRKSKTRKKEKSTN